MFKHGIHRLLKRSDDRESADVIYLTRDACREFAAPP